MKQKNSNDNSTGGAAAAVAAKESEEAFLTLLQRIQRQQSTNVAAMATRPPDEAATAMGRQLALKLATLGVPHEEHHTKLPVLPKGLQEKALQCLLQRQLNPAVVVSFLQTLVPIDIHSSRNNNKAPLVQCEWLPTWILQAETAVLEDGEESSYHALCCIIRTYAHYQWWWHQQELHHQWTRAVRRGISITEDNKDKSTPSFTVSSDPLHVATTFKRLQSAPARRRMIQECIQVAFSMGDGVETLATSATTNNNNATATSTAYAALGLTSTHSSLDGGYSLGLDEASVGSSVASTSHQQHRRRRRQEVVSGVTSRKLLQTMLSPLLSSCVLTLETPIPESMLFLETLWRECWSEMTTWVSADDGNHQDPNINAVEAQYDYFQALEWLTQALNIYLWGLPCHAKAGGKLYLASMDHLVSSKELAMHWLLQLLELGSFLVQTLGDNNEEDGTNIDQDLLVPSIHADPALQRALAEWVSRVATETVPRLFAVVLSYQVSLQAVLLQILQILQRLSNTVVQQHPEPHKGPSHTSKQQHSQLLEFFDTVAILRLSTVVMSNPVPSEVHILLRILHVAMSNGLGYSNGNGGAASTSSDSVTTLAMLRGLASMLLRKEGCQETSQELIQLLTYPTHGRQQQQQQQSQPYYKQPQRKQKSLTKTIKKIQATRSSFGTVDNVVEFLDSSIVDVDNFVAFLSKKNALQGTNFTAMQQSASLLFGIGLLMDDPKHQSAAYTYLNHLLEVYPHLGISLLPVLVDCLNAACVKGDATTLQRQLEFLCDSVVQDPQCAREIWNLLGVQFMTPTTPVVIRASIIRLFPNLCIANKRLYKRVVEALGNNLATSPNNVEIKLAVAATIADLAKEDRIRDVTDVIGWIQGFITEISWIRSVSTLDKEKSGSNAALVHYAVLALHYLLLAQELDFNLVILVLNKRLCNIHDMKEVVMLPPLVLETLVLLLGDGECEEEEDDEDNDGGQQKLQQAVVSPQVSKSVDTLIQLALSPKLHIQRVNQDMLLKGTLLRCRRNIQNSLSAYSMESLGIDEDGLKAVVAAFNNDEETAALSASGKRYESIRQIIEDGIRLMENDSYRMPPAGAGRGKDAPFTPDEAAASDISSSLSDLITNMLKFEEDVFGSTLWQKRGPRKIVTSSSKKTPYVQGQTRADPSQLQAVPTVTNVQKIYNENRCTATSLSVLLCFEGKPLSFLSDLAADAWNESADPFLLAFTVQAWLNAARATLMDLVMSFSSSEGLENVLTEVREWRFRLDTPDNMYLALSSLALIIPEILGPYGDHSPYVDEISQEVWSGYCANDIESEDIGRLCAGFAGVCALRNGSDELLNDVVDNLVQSVTGYSGQASFGAYFALATIAQSCQHAVESMEPEDERAEFVVGLVSRIVAFLVNELGLCITGNHAALASLIASIEDGEITPDVIDRITALGKKPIKMIKSRMEAAKSLFISMAISIPALAVVNVELLLGAFCLLEAMPWGYGKGMALSSVLQSCRKSGLFKNKEVEKIYSKYAKIFEDGMDKGVAGLDDIFYAVTATMTKTIPYSIRRFLVGNRTLFDEDGRAVSLLAAVVSLSTVPCLGCGAGTFTESPQLSPQATSEDIEGVNTLISEAVASREWTKYPQIGAILMGFLASMNVFADPSDGPLQTRSPLPTGNSHQKDLKLPTAQQGTVLDILMASLTQKFVEASSKTDESTSDLFVQVLGCLETLSLPGNFAGSLEQMFRGTDKTKTACTKLLISQVRGRPRAVFDGKDYLELALKISKMPPTSIKSMLGQGEASITFVEALADFVPKLSTDSVGEIVENFWRLCFNQVSNLPGMSIAFLNAMKALVKGGHDEKKSMALSPKTQSFLRNFLVTRVFAGIRDAPWTATSTSSTNEERLIVDTYAKCLLEVPVSTLVDSEFFTLKELDGFVGEALRYRCVMVLVRNGYFSSPARSSSEISSAIAWFSRQLTSSEEDIFSSTLLQVACAIAEATTVENPDRKKELLLTLLDNLLLTGPSASYVGLQMLAILVCRWVGGQGSDGDLSLMCLISSQMERWKELSPPTLQQTFHILVHDLPYNLATYARAEKISGIVFNRFWRVYNKWFEQGAEPETIDCVRRALVCCRAVDSGAEDFASLATSMISYL